MSYGIKESEEVLVATKILSVFLIKRLKDGVGVDDLVATIQKIVFDPKFLSAINAGIKDVKLVGKELADLDSEEISQLTGKAYEVVQAILGELGLALPGEVK